MATEQVVPLVTPDEEALPTTPEGIRLKIASLKREYDRLPAHYEAKREQKMDEIHGYIEWLLDITT